MRTIHRDVVGAFIFSKDGQVILGKTGKGGAYENKWVVAGGGAEKGETKLAAVKREVKEELGLDISQESIEELPSVSYGESQKTLRDTNERVLVKMTFFDFKVVLRQDASEIQLSLDDDLSEAEFFTASEAKNLQLGPATKATLQKIGYL